MFNLGPVSDSSPLGLESSDWERTTDLSLWQEKDELDERKRQAIYADSSDDPETALLYCLLW